MNLLYKGRFCAQSVTDVFGIDPLLFLANCTIITHIFVSPFDIYVNLIYSENIGSKQENFRDYMRVISKRKLRDYYTDNPQAKLPLVDWYYKLNKQSIGNISELKHIFNSVDAVYGYTVFDIGGNNYRLITAVHYNKQICYVRTIWTHAEYSKRTNQQKLIKGEL